MKKPPFVEVEWDDACSHSGWMTASDLETTRLFRNLTAGYLLSKDKKVVRVAQNLCPNGDTPNGGVIDIIKISDVMVIPTGWIKRIKVIRK